MPDALAWVGATTLHDPLLTPTIRLEPLDHRHAPDLFAAADPTLFLHSMQNPPEWSIRGFEREMDTIKAIPGVVAFAMVLASGPRAGAAIGRSTFMDIRPEHRGLEIGRTWIARPYHGTRVNPEAKYLMLRHAFESLSPTAIRVQITTSGTNLHSQHAIEKLGATREGVLRDARTMPPFPECPGREQPLLRDWVFYSILAREWPPVKARLEARLKEQARTP